MAAIKELLLRFMDELETEKLNRFKWYLKNNKSVSAAAIENANATGMVDIMVARFTPEQAVQVMLEILRKMNENHLAEQLENEYRDVGNAVDQMTRDAHTVDLTFLSGIPVNAPVLTRNNISNPVTLNFSSSSGAVGLQQYYCRTQKKVDPVVKFPAGLKSQSYLKLKKKNTLTYFMV
ncbi:LRR and PYD domains-containing 6-like protein [Labeo rohita]|uniref:LRR and PYD domains-containing 6-like protein n=1 Tax=Labeo rohita TaxID=84645 RepID=A0A498LYA6_LABRO|nr:LRR and PYD domains-containing 6-like protein [Labeo rohita]